MLRLDLKLGDSVKIGDLATLTLEDKSGKYARLAIQADKSIPIQRVQQDRSEREQAPLWGIMSVMSKGATN